MYLPKKIKIRGNEWLVKLIENPTLNGDTCDGLCQLESNELEIRKSLEGKELLEIFIHEWLHAVWAESGIDDEDSVNSFLEHWIINAIAKDMANNFTLWSKVFSSL